MQAHLIRSLAAVLPLALLAGAASPTNRVLPFQEISDEVGRRGAVDVRMLFTSREQYEAYFNHRAPAIDFDREWVVFYSAGIKPSTGYEAQVEAVQTTEGGVSLLITTRLISPGPDCLVERHMTKPFMLVKFPALEKPPQTVRFGREDYEMDCSP